MNDNREAIERKAYELWEAEGRPDGQHDLHWSRAEAMIAGAGSPSESLDEPAPAPAAAPKSAVVDAGSGGPAPGNSAAGKSAPGKRRKSPGAAQSQDTSLGPSDDLPVGRPDPQRISP